MSDFDHYDCANCEESFTAHPSARAADTGYCSPACQTAAEEY